MTDKTETYHVLTDLPPGLYALVSGDPVALDDKIMSLAGGNLFGFKINDTSMVTPKVGEVFFWCAEAASYFCLDNIYEELAIGLRWNAVTEVELDDEVDRILQLVGLGAVTPIARSVSPLDLSGGQQQRLLAGLVLTRQPTNIIGMNPLIYVEHAARAGLIRVLGQQIQAGGRRFVLPLDDFISADIAPSAFVSFDDDGYLSVSHDSYAVPRTADSDESKFPHSAVPISSCPTLRLRGLSYMYPTGHLGIHVPDAGFYPGCIYAICGPNGGGKSSLIRMLTDDHNITDRGALLEAYGKPVRNPFKTLLKTRRIAFSLQDPNLHLTGGTVRDFLQGCAEDQLLVDMRLDEYLDTDILAAPLWVRQASVFLLVVQSEPSIVLLDEPLDGIGYMIFGDTAIALLQRKAEQGKTILVVTHNAELAKRLTSLFVWVTDGIAAPPSDLRSPLSIPSDLATWLNLRDQEGEPRE